MPQIALKYGNCFFDKEGLQKEIERRLKTNSIYISSDGMTAKLIDGVKMENEKLWVKLKFNDGFWEEVLIQDRIYYQQDVESVV